LARYFSYKIAKNPTPKLIDDIDSIMFNINDIQRSKRNNLNSDAFSF
jgi:uncharacterized protein YbbC (DUF1343 family)